jgi:hypothetical protein
LPLWPEGQWLLQAATRGLYRRLSQPHALGLVLLVGLRLGLSVGEALWVGLGTGLGTGLTTGLGAGLTTGLGTGLEPGCSWVPRGGLPPLPEAEDRREVPLPPFRRVGSAGPGDAAALSLPREVPRRAARSAPGPGLTSGAASGARR